MRAREMNFHPKHTGPKYKQILLRDKVLKRETL